MNPLIPHFTNECLANIDQIDVKWPTIVAREIEDENINFVIQINGKKKILKVKNNIVEEDLLKEIKKNSETEKLIKNKKYKKQFLYQID